MSNISSNIKRSKKPMPLFGLFRKNKPDPIVAQQSQLGSGIASAPLNSVMSPTFYHQQQDPYSPPRIPKPSVSDSRRPRQQPPQQHSPQQQRQRTRQRSKSVGKDPSTVVLEERELALSKLCKREPPSSLVDSLPLLSPTYAAPPVPPIPSRHQPHSPSMRKFSSAHDLRKAAKLQQESMNQQIPLPINQELSRSRSLTASPRKLQSSKSHQNLVKSPTTPTYNNYNSNNNNNNNNSRNYKKLQKPRNNPDNNNSDDDDDIPLGYLQSPTSKHSSLLSDQEEDDDKDLVPIAVLDVKPTEEFQTAADKYKLKVKERLQFNSDQEDDDDDDDDIPISLALMSPKWKKKEIKRF